MQPQNVQWKNARRTHSAEIYCSEISRVFSCLMVNFRFPGSEEAIYPGDSGQHWRLPRHGPETDHVSETGQFSRQCQHCANYCGQAGCCKRTSVTPAFFVGRSKCKQLFTTFCSVTEIASKVDLTQLSRIWFCLFDTQAKRIQE